MSNLALYPCMHAGRFLGEEEKRGLVHIASALTGISSINSRVSIVTDRGTWGSAHMHGYNYYRRSVWI